MTSLRHSLTAVAIMAILVIALHPLIMAGCGMPDCCGMAGGIEVIQAPPCCTPSMAASSEASFDAIVVTQTELAKLQPAGVQPSGTISFVSSPRIAPEPAVLTTRTVHQRLAILSTLLI